MSGASGHVGGSAALRDEGHAVVGSRNDVETLANATGEADAVITTAEAENIELVTTLISVLEGTGKGLILMSGSSVVADDAQSAFASDKIYIEMTCLVSVHRLDASAWPSMSWSGMRG